MQIHPFSRHFRWLVIGAVRRFGSFVCQLHLQLQLWRNKKHGISKLFISFLGFYFMIQLTVFGAFPNDGNSFFVPYNVIWVFFFSSVGVCLAEGAESRHGVDSVLSTTINRRLTRRLEVEVGLGMHHPRNGRRQLHNSLKKKSLAPSPAPSQSQPTEWIRKYISRWRRAIHEILLLSITVCVRAYWNCAQFPQAHNTHRYTHTHWLFATVAALSTQKHHLAQHAFISLSVWVVWEQAPSSGKQLTPLIEKGRGTGRRQGAPVGWWGAGRQTRILSVLGSQFSLYIARVCFSVFWREPVAKYMYVRKLETEEPSCRTQRHWESQRHQHTRMAKSQKEAHWLEPTDQGGGRAGTRANKTKWGEMQSQKQQKLKQAEFDLRNAFSMDVVLKFDPQVNYLVKYIVKFLYIFSIKKREILLETILFFDRLPFRSQKNIQFTESFYYPFLFL